MSMLTPPGMQGKYKITGDTRLRIRQPNYKRRRVLAMTAAVVVLAVLGWGSKQLVDEVTAQPAPVVAARSCGTPAPLTGVSAQSYSGSASPAVALPQAKTITVNVYNATSRNGLAAKTAKELQKRGFRIGKVANAPAAKKHKVPESAQVVGLSGERGALLLVSAQEAGSLVIPAARHQAHQVDLYIGNGFHALRGTSAATAAAQAVANPPFPLHAAPGC